LGWWRREWPGACHGCGVPPAAPGLSCRDDGASGMNVSPSMPTRATLAAAWQSLRDHAPVVRCVINMVAAPRVADTLLAARASPAMGTNPHEAGPFAMTASALLVNLGTPYDETVAAMRAAVPQARSVGTPWVLDPVAAGGTAW